MALDKYSKLACNELGTLTKTYSKIYKKILYIQYMLGFFYKIHCIHNDVWNQILIDFYLNWINYTV